MQTEGEFVESVGYSHADTVPCSSLDGNANAELARTSISSQRRRRTEHTLPRDKTRHLHPISTSKMDREIVAGLSVIDALDSVEQDRQFYFDPRGSRLVSIIGDVRAPALDARTIELAFPRL